MARKIFTYKRLPDEFWMVVYRNPVDDAIIHMPTDDPNETTDTWIKVGVWKPKKSENDYMICA
tara:strand:+ start:816 stop:1004 length:189 start_codon:yes stop_codon:yes gene_type:complete